MDRQVSLFAGAAGRVLLGAISLQSLISGLVLGFVLLVGNFVLLYAGAHVLVTPLTQVVLAFALARFVLNGQYGEWDGTMFSGVGGSWGAVALVAARYLLLTAIWVVPLMLFGLRIDQAALGAGALGAKAGILGSIYLLASALSPPLFLIVSVTAQDFGEIFSPSHWRELFGGRTVDLLSIYAVYTGGVAVAVVLCMPLVLLGFQPSWKFGVFVLGLAVCFLLGLCMNLLGRLCGFYALGEFADPIDSEPRPVNLPEPGMAPVVGGANPQPVTAEPPVREREPIQVSEVPPRRPPDAAVASGPEQTPPAGTPQALPALLDASKRIDPILRRFQQDPPGALTALEDLRQSFAPHPQVLVALCVCRHRNGEVEEAVRLAETVVPICFERGHVQLAAQVFKQLRREVDRLGLNREQILILGDTLAKKDDLVGAGAAYSIAIGRDPGETRAVKGLLQIAGSYSNERDKPEAALKVYDYLLKHCSDSPLAEFMREGRTRCLTQLAQPVG